MPAPQHAPSSGDPRARLGDAGRRALVSALQPTSPRSAPPSPSLTEARPPSRPQAPPAIPISLAASGNGVSPRPSGSPKMFGMGSKAVLAVLASAGAYRPIRPRLACMQTAEHLPDFNTSPTGTATECQHAQGSTVATPAEYQPATSPSVAPTEQQPTSADALQQLPTPDEQLPTTTPTLQNSRADQAPGKGRKKKKSKPTTHRIPMTKRAAMTAYYREGKAKCEKVTLTEAAKIGGCSVSQAGVWCARDRDGEGLANKPKGRPAKWPVQKAVLEIAKELPILALDDDAIKEAAGTAGINPSTFRYIRKDVTDRLQSAVLDFWFNGDKRGETEIIKYITDPERKEIKIGMFLLSNKRINQKLLDALAAGVRVLLMVDLSQARGKGIECVADLIRAGAQVCHSTSTFHWKTAIFDGRILIHGSQNWTNSGMLGPNFECTIVLGGPIVSCFEKEFGRMWRIATQDLRRSKRAKAAVETEPHDEEMLEEYWHSAQETQEASGSKRKRARKRTLFPTTLALLGLH